MAAVSKQRRRIHMGAEILAMTVVAPVTAYIAATNPGLARWEKAFLYTVSAATVAVDGYL
jgi:hypothetical protein